MMIRNEIDEEKTRDQKILLAEIHSTKRCLFSAYQKFNHAIEPEIIDCCIYEMNAAQLRYQYLLEKAKKIGLTDLPKLRYTVQTVWK